jgi:hypothetical protein
MLHTIGNDGQYLLEAIAKARALDCENLLEIQHLRREWKRQFEIESGNCTLRSMDCNQCSGSIAWITLGL